MKKQLSIIMVVIFVFSLLFPVIASAVQITIDTDNLSEQTATQVLQAAKEAEKAKTPTADQVEEWVGIGEKVGKAIAATCKELAVEVNEFVKTPVGIITMLLIIWKVVGQDFWSIVGGTLCWIVVTSIIMWSYRHFHMRERIEDKETKDVKYIKRYEFNTNDARTGSATCHAIAFVLITFACILIVF